MRPGILIPFPVVTDSSRPLAWAGLSSPSSYGYVTPSRMVHRLP